MLKLAKLKLMKLENKSSTKVWHDKCSLLNFIIWLVFVADIMYNLIGQFSCNAHKSIMGLQN